MEQTVRVGAQEVGLGSAGTELEGPVNQAGSRCQGLLPGGGLWGEP